MLRLLPNTADQEIFLTLFEKKKFLPAFENYLMVITNEASREDWALIIDPTTDNNRYTKAIISTDNLDPTNGEVLIEQTGQFWYFIYGQNSTTNLDPTDASVVGLVEKGVIQVITQESYYNVPDITIPDTIIYYD